MRNIGVIFKQAMSLNEHIKQICSTAFLYLHNMSKIGKKNIISQSDAEKLVHATHSRLNYYISLLWSCSKSSLKGIQLIQTAEVKLELKIRYLTYSFLFIGSVLNTEFNLNSSFSHTVMNDYALSYLGPFSRISNQQSISLSGWRGFSFLAAPLWNQPVCI